MGQEQSGQFRDDRQLKHDVANDLYSLRMNVDALNMMRESEPEFSELIQMMHRSLSMLEERLGEVLNCSEEPQRVTGNDTFASSGTA